MGLDAKRPLTPTVPLSDHSPIPLPASQSPARNLHRLGAWTSSAALLTKVFSLSRASISFRPPVEHTFAPSQSSLATSLWSDGHVLRPRTCHRPPSSLTHSSSRQMATINSIPHRCLSQDYSFLPPVRPRPQKRFPCLSRPFFPPRFQCSQTSVMPLRRFFVMAFF